MNFNHASENTTKYEWNSIPNDIGVGGGNDYINRNTYTDNAGEGKDYMPEYITVYAWYRTA